MLCGCVPPLHQFKRSLLPPLFPATLSLHTCVVCSTPSVYARVINIAGAGPAASDPDQRVGGKAYSCTVRVPWELGWALVLVVCFCLVQELPPLERVEWFGYLRDLQHLVRAVMYLSTPERVTRVKAATYTFRSYHPKSIELYAERHPG